MVISSSYLRKQTAVLISFLSVPWLLPSRHSILSISGHCSGQTTWTEQLRNFTVDTGPSRLHMSSHNLHLPCPSEATGASMLQNLSVCPWTNDVDFDFDRFPPAMTFARCSCGTCSDSSRHGATRSRRRCVPLYHTFHVMRRVCEAGNFRYMMSFDRLPIACVCIHTGRQNDA
ncbi:hypothetical protein RRG08_030307 [Elysia crispata]|uniref:Interleukin 17-like protein n=1 Tax=Elysia crispata TaxID=231223 RepID=A0AAE0YI77_9GAST|nr:hypothetical protein RRG08_030307 [Elysia crispata]